MPEVVVGVRLQGSSVWQLLGMFDPASERGSHLNTCFEALKTPKTP